MTSTTDNDLKEELEHYHSVVLSFREYDAYLLREIFHRKLRIERLPDKYKKHLSENTIPNRIKDFAKAIRANQQFLDRVIMSQAPANSGKQEELPVPIRGKIFSPERHFSKINSTFHQCVRDWSKEGALERQQCYDPILEEITRLLPVTSENRNKQKVLVPGAGLGRLALELVGEGYAVQGNEFSHQMLFVSNYILNSINKANQAVIYPWIDNPSNTMDINDSLRPVHIPDTFAADFVRDEEESSNLGEPPDFSMLAGEFLEAYKNQQECWDCIVTCFFIDTAPNVLEYLETIIRLLKPGGMWINLGPLQYHWQNPCGDNDIRYEQSIELSYKEIRHFFTSCKMKILREERRQCYYTCNQLSMSRNVYDCVFSSAVKTNGDVDFSRLVISSIDLPNGIRQEQQ